MSMSRMPSGNIAPSRFVKIDSTKAGGYVAQAGAGDVVFGISEQGVRQPPITGLDDGYAGILDSNSIVVFTEKDECWIECGAAVTEGDLLKSDANGKGITAGSDGDYYGAQAEQTSTAAGQLVRVVVKSGYRGA